MSAPLRGILSHECELLVERLRGFTLARYAAAAPPFGDRAGLVRHLAQRLVDLAGVARQLPELPPMALADVLAVTAHDLDAELSRLPAETAVSALREVLLHRYDLDGALPGPRAAAAAGAAGPADLLRVARGNCPAQS